MANFWQAGPPQWRPHQQCAIAAAAFYSAKSRQGLGLGGLASQTGPDPDQFDLSFKVGSKEHF